MANRLWVHIGSLAVAVLTAVLLLTALGDRALWDDEAQTALLARQVATHGFPVFEAGANLPTDRADLADFNEQRVFIWNTWLPYYLGASSFLLLGESEWSARLPFALCGLLTFALYGLVAWRLFMLENKPATFLLALLLLALSVPFLLHARQCRYYAPAMLGTLWMVWGYLAVLEGKRSGSIHFSLGAIVSFHAFFVSGALNVIALVSHALWKERRATVFRGLGMALAVITIACVPSTIYMHLWSHPGDTASTLPGALRSFGIYLLWMNGFVFPFAVPVAVAFLSKLKGRVALLAAYALFIIGTAANRPELFMLAAAAAASLVGFFAYSRRQFPQSPACDEEACGRRLYQVTAIMVTIYLVVVPLMSPFPFFRYVAPLLPLVLIAGAAMIGAAIEWNRAAGVALAFCVLTSNLVSALPLKLAEPVLARVDRERQEYSLLPQEVWRWTTLRSDIASYLHEVTHSIADPEKMLAAYFQKNGIDDQVIKASFGDTSLMYYVPRMRVISRWDTGGGIPDYVIVRGPYPLARDKDFLDAISGVRYQREQIPTPDVVWSNSPDPLFHLFAMPDDKPNLVLFRKRESVSQ